MLSRQTRQNVVSRDSVRGFSRSLSSPQPPRKKAIKISHARAQIGRACGGGEEREGETERRRRRETPGITQAPRYKTLAPRAKRCAFAKHKHEESKEAQSLSYTRLGRRPAREVESVKSFWRPLDCRKTLICLQECFVPQRTMDLYNSRVLQYER